MCKYNIWKLQIIGWKRMAHATVGGSEFFSPLTYFMRKLIYNFLMSLKTFFTFSLGIFTYGLVR